MERSEIQTLEHLLLQMASVTQALDERSRQAVAEVAARASALDAGLRALVDGSDRFVHEITQAVGADARQVIVQGAGSAMVAFNRQLQTSAGAAQDAARVMEAQCRRLVVARCAVVWSALGALLIGASLALGSAGYVAWQARQTVADARFPQDIQRATQRGVLTRCGDELCVKVGKPLRRYAGNPAYVLLAE